MIGAAMSRWGPCLLAGIALGVVWTASPGAILILCLLALTSLALYRAIEARDRRFVLWLFLTGFVLRAVLSLSLDGLAWAVERERALRPSTRVESNLERLEHTRRFLQIPDSDYYSQRANALTQRTKGLAKSYNYHERYGQQSYLFVMGAFYFLVGHSPMTVKLLNCLLGALLGPAMWALARHAFNGRVACWTGVLVTVFPSLVLWSVTNLKEPLLFLLTAGLFLLSLRITRRRDRLNATSLQRVAACGLAFLLVLYVHSTLRSPVYSAVFVGSLVLGHVLGRRVPWRWLLAGTALVIGIAVVAQPRIQRILSIMVNTHIGHVRTHGGSPYTYLPEPFYATADTIKVWAGRHSYDWRLLPWTGRALAHYLMEPFPWKADNLFRITVFPQMILWYACLGFALRGVWRAVRWRRRQTLFLILPAAIWILLGAMTNGDVGTVFRFRDMVTPVVLLFACAGLSTIREIGAPVGPSGRGGVGGDPPQSGGTDRRHVGCLAPGSMRHEGVGA